MSEERFQRIAVLENYIMKNCLWQFHSRAWDRKRQNEKILTATTQILCGNPEPPPSPDDRVYWVDAVCLAEAYQKLPWWPDLAPKDIQDLMQGLRERVDFVTVDGSLNLELTDQHY